MNQAEFNAWWDHHATFYPGLHSWLNKQPLPAAILGVWAKTLSGTALERAREASESLYNREHQPMGYERHAAIVRVIAAENDGLSRTRSMLDEYDRLAEDQPSRVDWELFGAAMKGGLAK